MTLSSQDLITDIIFDLGKVLVPFDWNIAFQKLALCGNPDTIPLVARNRREFLKIVAEPANRLERGQLTFSEFYGMIVRLTGLNVHFETFREIWCDIFWANEDVINIGRVLAQSYSCWLMSNTSEAHYDWIIKKFPDIRFYKKAALSYELGFMKPEPRYYIEAMKLFAVNPGNALFIDDIQENLDGAAIFGIRTIRFDGARNLIQRLRDYGVRI